MSGLIGQGDDGSGGVQSPANYILNDITLFRQGLDGQDLGREGLQIKTLAREIKINDKELEFSSGFKDLHTVSYQNILNGKGFDIVDSKKSINVVSEIKNKEIEKINKKECHRLIK